MAGRSNDGEGSSFNLLLPFLEGREFLVVVFKVFPKLVKLVLDVLVDPRFLLELENQVERVDHRQVFKAAFISLEVVEKHADNTHDFLLVEVIQDFSNTLNNTDLIVSEVVQGEVVVGKNPQSRNDIVGNLSGVHSNLSGVWTLFSTCAVVLEQVRKYKESLLCGHILLSKLVGLAASIKSGSEG